MNPLASLGTLDQAMASVGSKTEPPADMQVREAFQDFVAGTFFKQMLKALRSTQQDVAYFHGGAAEEVFEGQMDQQVAEDLAKTHGRALSDSLFDAFMQQQKAVEPAAAQKTPPTIPLFAGQNALFERK